jgi:hypothetical protein
LAKTNTNNNNNNNNNNNGQNNIRYVLYRADFDYFGYNVSEWHGRCEKQWRATSATAATASTSKRDASHHHHHRNHHHGKSKEQIKSGLFG